MRPFNDNEDLVALIAPGLRAPPSDLVERCQLAFCRLKFTLLQMPSNLFAEAVRKQSIESEVQRVIFEPLQIGKCLLALAGEPMRRGEHREDTEDGVRDRNPFEHVDAIFQKSSQR